MPESQKFSWINHDAVNSHLNQNVKNGWWNSIFFMLIRFDNFVSFQISLVSVGGSSVRSLGWNTPPSWFLMSYIFEMHVYWISSKKFVQNVFINRREKDWYIYELKDIGTILIDWLNICNFCSSISKSQGPPKILCFELLNVSLYYMYCVRLM